ncbi:MAG: cell division protein FtsL [Desulfobacterota bacterium]|jgi:cell division protein FtsL|nr:cell division protein FtsL [Thermodesulfobacteriota bacterium]
MRRLNPARAFPFCLIMLMVLSVWAMFHVWSRHMVTELGYSLSEEQGRNDQLMSENKALRIEISTLKSPKRLELIATGQLGLSAPKPEQVVYLWLDD